MKRLFTSFALTMLLMLGASGIAIAQTTTNYTCMEGGNPPPPSNSGNIIITEPGKCTLDGANYMAGVSTIGGYLQLTAGGAITITTTIPGAGLLAAGQGGYVSVQGGGKITLTGDINATSYIYITAADNLMVTGTVNATAGNILVVGQKKVATGAITGAANGGYNIDLKAEQGDSSPAPFVIDRSSSSAANGVNGMIIANAGSSGSVIYITNGGAGSQGDIKLKDATGLVVSGSTVTGGIILNAQNGTLTMPGGAKGTLSADGNGTAIAGQIQLLAQTVAFQDKGVLSASQSTTTAGALHGVAISAASITFGSNKLEIHADGNGGVANGAFAYLLPEGATTITDTNDPLLLPINVTNLTTMQGAMSITGAGELDVTANGDQAIVGVFAYPITIQGAPVLLQSRGMIAGDHQVYVQNPAPLSGMTGLTLGGPEFTLDASAKGGGANGGVVNVMVDQAQLGAVTIFSLTANGPSGARQNGNAGTIAWQSSTVAPPLGTASFTANGSGNGSGNNIAFNPNSTNISLGNGPGQFALSATGGSASSNGGNGGTITVNPNVSGNITVAGPGAAFVSALGTQGNGGKIFLFGNPSVNFTGSNLTLSADGASQSGNGGEVHIIGNGSILVGTTADGANAVTLSAQAPGTANSTSNNAGIIEIANASSLLVDGAAVLLTTGGNANGGQINFHNLGTLTVTNTLAANASGTGSANSNTAITLSSSAFNQMTLDHSIISGAGGQTGTGAGGTIAITNAGPISMAGTTVSASASPNGTQAGGTINILITGGGTQPLNLSQPGTSITAAGGTNGAGGNLIVSNASSFDINGVVTVDAGSGTLANTAIFDGIIQLNGTACRQWHTGSPIWPLAYWDCTGNVPPGSLDAAPADLASTHLIPNLQDRINARPTVLYVFTDGTGASAFFSVNASVDLGGFTFQTDPPSSRIYTSVFENVNSVTHTLVQMRDVTAHEIGHAVDFLYGNASLLPIYTTYATADLQYLDYDSPNGSHRRDPCVASGNTVAPFFGVTDDSTGQPFCTAGVLEPGMYRNTNGTYWSNSLILQTVKPIWFAPTVNNEELNAQTFSVVIYIIPDNIDPGVTGNATTSGVEKNQFFQCAQFWGFAEASSGTIPPNNPPASCTMVAGWYVPFQH